MNNINLEALMAIKPRAAKLYAKSKGWSFVKDFKNKYYIYEKSSLGQLLIPKDMEAVDYSNRVWDIVSIFSKDEERDVQSVINDLFNPEADVYRFRLKGSKYSDGTAPLVEGMNLYSGSRKSIYIAALQSQKTQSFYKRLSNSEIDTFISYCKMGQTERGSFIASLVCPLSIPGFESNLSLFNDPFSEPQSFTRKVTTNYLNGIDSILKTIDEDNPDNLKYANGDFKVSSNFCNSIVEMQPDSDDSGLEISLKMSSSDYVPKVLSTRMINKDYFSLIEQIARDLKPRNSEEVKSYYGKVKTLNGSPGNDGLMQGEVIITFIDDDRVVKAKVNLSDKEYKIAHSAHISDNSVLIKGVLEDGARISKFKSFEKFDKV